MKIIGGFFMQNLRFTGYVYDNNIYNYTGEQIGVNLARYQEVEQALVKCKNRLIELGEIKVPKTPEQIIEEQQALLDKQTFAINQLLEKVNELELHHQPAPAEHTGEHESCVAASITDSRPVVNKNKGRRSKGNKSAQDAGIA